MCFLQKLTFRRKFLFLLDMTVSIDNVQTLSYDLTDQFFGWFTLGKFLVLCFLHYYCYFACGSQCLMMGGNTVCKAEAFVI